MARGKRGPVPEALADRIEVVVGGELLGKVESKNLEKMLENPVPAPEAANGHAEPAIAEQPELFREPGTVIKYVNVSPAPEVLDEHRKALADLAQEYLAIKDAKKAADAGFNTQISEIDTKMREIVLAIKYSGQYPVECEWRVIDGNARGLFRLDTGECIEMAALTAEDRAAELEQAQDMNEVPF